MSFNDADFLFGKFNCAVDKAWDESISNGTEPFVPPRGAMTYLSGTLMGYLDGDGMVYLET